MYYLLYRNHLHVSALFMAIFRLIMRNLTNHMIRTAVCAEMSWQCANG